jgi:hypothetical protein
MTAYITGTCPDAATFWTLLLDFLTTDTDLVAAGENWEEVWANEDESQRVLKGPGLAGTDSVYIGLRFKEVETTDEHSIYLSGYTGILAEATHFTQHFGRSPEVAFFLDTNPMQYWLVASGRRFVVVAKSSTVYESAYAGLYLPYSLPAQYPYPLFVGAMKGYKNLATNNWRSVEQGHSAWFNPYRDNALGADVVPSSAYFLDPLSTWYPIVNLGYRQDANIAHMLPNYAGPANAWGTDNYASVSTDAWGAVEPGSAGAESQNTMGYAPAFSKTGRTLDGGYVLQPLSLVQCSPAVSLYGVMDGVHAVPGDGNSAENTVTIDGKTYLVIPNAFRSNNSDYVAVCLE